jgi:hypothetical protein
MTFVTPEFSPQLVRAWCDHGPTAPPEEFVQLQLKDSSYAVCPLDAGVSVHTALPGLHPAISRSLGDMSGWQGLSAFFVQEFHGVGEAVGSDRYKGPQNQLYLHPVCIKTQLKIHFECVLSSKLCTLWDGVATLFK